MARRRSNYPSSSLPNRRAVARNFASLLWVAIAFSAPAIAEDWPAWRGPQFTGISHDQNLPLHWDQKQNLRWHVALPDRGNSTPVIAGGRVFVTQAIEKDHRRTLMCFSLADGKLLWQRGVSFIEHEPTNAQNPYCSASPAADASHVVAYFGSAGLYCYDPDGKELWHRDIGKVDSWQGGGSSPILFGKLCILNAGPGTSAALIACNTSTGDVVWRVSPPKVTGGAAPGAPPPAGGGFDNAMMQADPSGAGGFLGSWSTPVVIHSGDHDELLVVHAFELISYNPANGKPIWTCKGLPEQAFASPAVGDGIVLASGHKLAGGGTRLTAVKLGGAGDVTATHRLWQIDMPKECVGSGVIAGGNAYLVTQFGSVICLDLATGRKLHEKRLPGNGTLGGSWSSIVLNDDRLIIPNQSAETFILQASPALDLLATDWPGEETTCASPAIADGCLLLRTYKSLWCFANGGGASK